MKIKSNLSLKLTSKASLYIKVILSSKLNFLTFLQDEIHRFVITYHRQLRDTVKLKDGKVYKGVEKKK